MTTMNPEYAFTSDVGPVFDVATFSRGKTLMTGATAIVFAALIGGSALYVWNPQWLVQEPPQWFADAHQDMQDVWRTHPRVTSIGVATAAVLAGLCGAAAVSCIAGALWGSYYLRAGEGGVSLRVPNGFGTLAVDLSWQEIAKLTVVQEKKFGSLSRNAGNVGASLSIKTCAGKKYYCRLDAFSQPGYLIHQRIEEAREMRPAVLAAE